MAKNVTVGDFVSVPGNAEAWKTGFVKAITATGKILIGFGSRNTPNFLLRYGSEKLYEINEIEVI